MSALKKAHRFGKKVGWTVCAVGAVYSPFALAQETGFTATERELAYLAKILPGDYDNQEQVSFDARAMGTKENAQPRYHVKIAPANLPKLGEHVFFAEINQPGIDDTSIKRLYVLSADEDARAVRAAPFALKAKSTFSYPERGSEEEPKLSAGDWTPMEGCDLLFKRDTMALAGHSNSETCKDSDGNHIEQHISVSKDMLTLSQRAMNAEGAVVAAIADFKPRKMQRARWFACMVDVPYEAGGRPINTQHYMKLHDQGGQFDFKHPDGRDMTVVMRNTWSYGMQRETFFVGIFEGSATGKLLVYGWGAPGADRIGINPGYVRIQCDLDTPENVKLQEGLRAES